MKNSIYLNNIVHNDSLDNLKVLHSYGYLDLGRILSKAAGNNSDKVCKWIYNLDPSLINICDECPFRWACENGNFEIAQWLYKKSPSINIHARNDYSFNNTCKNGHLDIAQWLHNIITINNDHFSDSTLICSYDWAIQSGQINVIIWLDTVNANTVIDYNHCFRTACKKGHLDIAKYLYTNFIIDIYSESDYAFYYACRNNHLNIVEWLYSLDNTIINYIKIYNLVYHLVTHGYVETLEWIYMNVSNIDININHLIKRATKNNRDTTVDFLKKQLVVIPN